MSDNALPASAEVAAIARPVAVPPVPAQVRRSGIAQAVASADGLSLVSQLFGKTAGRELSPDAIACLMFLRQHGCGELVDQLMEMKIYQTSTRELGDFVEKLSAATAHKELIEAQAKATQSRV